MVRYLRGRLTDGGEDVASQVWLDVARNIGRYTGDDEGFTRWLFTIAHRRYVDHVRTTVRRPEHTVDAVEHAERGALQSLPPAPDAATEFDRMGAVDRALALVRLLPDSMAEVVLLRVVADLSVAEVAEITGKQEGHVRVLAHRGLERLRNLAEPSSDGDRPENPARSVTNPDDGTIETVT